MKTKSAVKSNQSSQAIGAAPGLAVSQSKASVRINGSGIYSGSDSEITATVPAGVTSDKVSVVTPSKSLNRNKQFFVTK